MPNKNKHFVYKKQTNATFYLKLNAGKYARNYGSS
jgi:hypothetical protein